MGRLLGQLTPDVWRSLLSGLPCDARGPAEIARSDTLRHPGIPCATAGSGDHDAIHLSDVPDAATRLVRRYDPVPCARREAS
jgi:hypothetical protein